MSPIVIDPMYPDGTAEESGYWPEIRLMAWLEPVVPFESPGTDCAPLAGMRIRQIPRKTRKIPTEFELRRSLGGGYPAPPTVECFVVRCNPSSTAMTACKQPRTTRFRLLRVVFDDVCFRM